MPDRSPDSAPGQAPDSAPDHPPSGGHRAGLWSLLGLFAACVPCALLVVEKLGSSLSPVPLVLTVLAALAGYVLAVRALVGERFGQHPRRYRTLVWMVAGVLFVGSVVVLFAFRPPPPPLTRMSGARDVAVVGFAAGGGRQDQRVLDDVAETFAHDMAARIPTATAVRSYAGEAQLPLTQLADTHRGTLERKTARFADETNAEVVVGGLVSEDRSGQSTLRPAVYVRADQIPDSPEITGWVLGSPILVAQGWESARARSQLTAELSRRIGALARFVDALDTWRNGSPREAARTLAGLLDAERQDDTGSFVPPDLVRLFHGHALEAQALDESGPGKEKLLAAARADYLAIGPDSPAGRRAALSLQLNTYRQALGSASSCKPGTVRAADLAQASKALRDLAADPGVTELGRIKATVNLSQVEECRIRARLVKDDGTVERAAATVRAAQDLTGSADLRALAESIAATHAADRGDLAGAVDHIRDAIAHGRDPVQRSVWHGLLASWSLKRCDLATGRRAWQDALTQLAAAERAGRADSARLRQYEQISSTELRRAEERCGNSR
ncbi:hypothetical protein WDV06_11750 [Streptomyces racemochromogenes]|uniref:Integral membrane protein n=1 Tax=Streptomyces racemochromogenes TaxID=67353 RepID=A0ABW7PBM8_9ACTN